MSTNNGVWGKKRVKINGRTYYPCIYSDGSFKSIVGYIFENPRYFITNDGLTLMTSNGDYFKVYNSKNYVSASNNASAIAGNAIIGNAIVGM